MRATPGVRVTGPLLTAASPEARAAMLARASVLALPRGASILAQEAAADRLLILLHIFAKRTGKIPASDVTIAHDRWADFKARMDADPRRPPRAAGPLPAGRA